MLDVRILGETQVHSAGSTLGLRDFGGVKTRQIFEILVLHRGRPITKDQLAELLWDGRPPGNYTATLESYVSMLRARLEPGVARRDSVIVTGTSCYVLDANKVRVDEDIFDELARQASRQPAAAALRTLAKARALSPAGALLAHEPYATWTEKPRRRHHEALLEVTLRAARLSLELGHTAEVVLLADAATALDPFSESACHLAMKALWLTDRRPEAMARYRELSQRLHDELGIEPRAELRAQWAALLSGLPAARKASPERRAGQADQADLVGQQDQTGLPALVDAVVELYRRVHSPTALVVQGFPGQRRAVVSSGSALGAERLLAELVAMAGGDELELATAQ